MVNIYKLYLIVKCHFSRRLSGDDCRLALAFSAYNVLGQKMSIRFLRSSHMITILSYMDILNTKCLIIIASLTAKLSTLFGPLERTVLPWRKKGGQQQNGPFYRLSISARWGTNAFQLSGWMHCTTWCFVDEVPLESEVYPSLPLGTKKRERSCGVRLASHSLKVIEIQLFTMIVDTGLETGGFFVRVWTKTKSWLGWEQGKNFFKWSVCRNEPWIKVAIL